MKAKLYTALLLIFGALHVSGSENTVHLLLPEFFPTLVREIQPTQLKYTESNISVVEIPFDQVEKFAALVHENHPGCGGFIDITHEIQRGKSPQRIVWEEMTRKKLPQLRFGQSVTKNPQIQALVNQANPEKWENFLKELTAFPDRSATTDLGKDAANFLEARAKQHANENPAFSTRQIKTGSSFYSKQPSIVATLKGSRPELGHVVIGGHMDTFSDGKPGADDDGSGSAAVMEVLRTILVNKAQFERTIDFVWYAAEERGLVGSSFVVEAFKAENIPVEAVIQFDMVGFKHSGDEADIHLITDYTNSSLTAKLRKLIETYTLARVGETQCGYACSDHANWHRMGIPAVFPFETSFDNMNHRLHTNDDKVSYLDKMHAKYFLQTGIAFLGEMARLENVRLY